MHLLVIGDALLDTYLEGEAARLSRDGPIPVVRKTREQRLLGGAANVAANLQALGAHVSFLSIVGQDSAGSLLREALRERDIDDRWLLTDPLLHTPHKLRIMADGQHIARFDEGDGGASHYAPETQQRLLACLEEVYPLCHAIVISDYGYGVISRHCTDQIQRLQHAHPNPKMILVDAQELTRFCHFPCTIVTPNYQEASRFVEAQKLQQDTSEEARPANLNHVEYLARQLRSCLSARYIAITLAEQGVFLLDQQENANHFPAHPVAVAHDVGAGDSFASALALALAAGGVMAEAVPIAIDAAGIAVTKPRTAVVSYQELLQRVSVRVFTGRQALPDHPLARLAQQLEVARAEGKTIVFTNGVFDILHVGHMHFLRQAKSLGDILVVGVNSDRSTQRLKGPGRPINTEQDRLALVEVLDMVDYGILFDGDTATELIRTLRPSIYVKGGDYTDDSLPEAAVVQEEGGQTVILPLIGAIRTSSMIQRIKSQ